MTIFLIIYVNLKLLFHVHCQENCQELYICTTGYRRRIDINLFIHNSKKL